MKATTLTSRIPQISAELRPRVNVALEAGAELIATAAKARVPVATGRLREAIHVDRRGQGVYVIAGDKDTFYGHIVEHGGAHSPAQPFLIPAVEESRVGIEMLVMAELRRL